MHRGLNENLLAGYADYAGSLKDGTCHFQDLPDHLKQNKKKKKMKNNYNNHIKKISKELKTEKKS